MGSIPTRGNEQHESLNTNSPRNERKVMNGSVSMRTACLYTRFQGGYPSRVVGTLEPSVDACGMQRETKNGKMYIIYNMMKTIRSTGYTMWVPTMTNAYFDGDDRSGKTFCEVASTAATSPNIVRLYILWLMRASPINNHSIWYIYLDAYF